MSVHLYCIHCRYVPLPDPSDSDDDGEDTRMELKYGIIQSSTAPVAAAAPADHSIVPYSGRAGTYGPTQSVLHEVTVPASCSAVL